MPRGKADVLDPSPRDNRNPSSVLRRPKGNEKEHFTINCTNYVFAGKKINLPIIVKIA